MPHESASNIPRSSPKTPRRKGRSSGYGGERRIVTALSYDLVGSTDLFHVMDIEDYQDLIAGFQSAAKQSITARSGVMLVEAGDGGVALFPAELGARDAASLAIRAGLGIIDACKRLSREVGRHLHVRIGIATSVALIQKAQEKDKTQEPIAGASLAMATRLQAIAAPDSVLVSEETRNLAGRSHAFVFEGIRTLKGFAEPEKVWRALGHKKEVDRFYAFGRLDGPFIGRTRELGMVAKSWKSVLEGHGEVLSIEGDAGIGKSRLLHEIRKITQSGRSKSFLFQCLPGGFRSTLHPLRNSFPGSDSGGQSRLTAAAVATQFQRHGVFDADVIEVFTHILGASGRNEVLSNLDPKAVREKARRAMVRALEMMSVNGPIVIAIEDIHWIDPTSQDLLAEASRVVEKFPILLVATFRPGPSMEWLNERNPTRIELEPLDREEARLAIEAGWPEHRKALLPELIEVTERISAGIPLFIQEICRWFSESAETDPMKMSGKATPGHIPALAGILDARLDNLGFARDIALAAAVSGARVTLPLLRALLPDFSKKSLVTAADALCETGFLTQIRMPGTIAYGFRHALIRETIYNTLLRKQRRILHGRLFAAVSQDREIAPWFDIGAVAEHAEHADLLEEAIDRFILAGKESSSRSAMVEAQHYLEHALALCDKISESSSAELLQLSALTALGPVLTATVGQNSPPARKLYEDGVAIARRRPMEEQSEWFPIYWGWWLTGKDFLVMHERALEVQVMLSQVDDPETRLQVNHCIWAIEFNVGRHRETQDAIAAGLALYDERLAKTSRTLFGGHDAKVCGLGQLALSLWLTGQVEASDKALSEMVAFVDGISHAPSKAHSLDTEAVSAFYRNDHERLVEISLRMGEFARQHEMQSLSGLSLLFGGWANAHSKNRSAGFEMFQEGLSLLRRLGAVADLPIYLYMHATMLGLAGNYASAIEVATDAIREAKDTGHAYWLAELYRGRAVLHAKGKAGRELAAADLRTAVKIAANQGAVALHQRAIHSIRELAVDVEF
ncbi:AAA family ATPase (plasmid) [Rhizobium sp. CC1099]|uniref:ATP-binding protein n=1 Tax=unclassified Rhizobium TaxID=2613769 RepID=UPI00188F006A|nr:MULTISPECIES: AAA family ATPase [unclassified Rhizobium]QPB23019.1 AAA family ATPase [Rhizobium sp. 007]WFU89877.1 AAA family ATPase [Rhizobium sp. CC1099]